MNWFFMCAAYALGVLIALICGDQVWPVTGLCFFLAGGFFERARDGRWWRA